MKKKLLVFAALGLVYTAKAQQRPHYTQYILNQYIINPAVAGIENYTDVKLSHRHQWVGLDGAPVTTYVTIHGPLTKSNYDRENPTTFHAPGQNPRGKAYWQEYTKADPHSGIGFTMMNDRTGPLNRFSVAATYAYHVGIAERTSLSAGITAGIQNMTLNTSKLNFEYPIDPAVAGSGYLNKLRPDINAGLWLYSARYFVGLAAQNIISSKLSFAEDTLTVTESGKFVPHMFLSAGYRTFLSEDVSFLPSVTVRYINPMPLGVDINAKVQYQDLVWAGASYRLQDGFAAMVGVNVSSSFNVGYSYDYTTSRLNTVSRGSHEIIVGFLLGNRYGDWCPRNNW